MPERLPHRGLRFVRLTVETAAPSQAAEPLSSTAIAPSSSRRWDWQINHGANLGLPRSGTWASGNFLAGGEYAEKPVVRVEVAGDRRLVKKWQHFIFSGCEQAFDLGRQSDEFIEHSVKAAKDREAVRKKRRRLFDAILVNQPKWRGRRHPDGKLMGLATLPL